MLTIIGKSDGKKCLSRTGWMVAKASVRSEAKRRQPPRRTDRRRGSGRSAIGESRKCVARLYTAIFPHWPFENRLAVAGPSSVFVNFAM